MNNAETQPFRFSERSNNLPSSFLRDILKVASSKDVISFAGGLPDPSLFPLKELADCADSVFRSHGSGVLQYSNSEGLMSLKEWICNYYYNKFEMHVHPDQILITNGSQQALDLIGKTFLDKGDEIILEQPSYLGAIQAFTAYQPRILPIPITHDGLDLNSLEQALLNHQPKLLYLVSNFQNPSGFTISREKREQLAELASRYNLIIVEDDPYGELRYTGSHLKPILSYYPRTLLCGSFSKMIAPGLRLGWVVGDATIIRKMLIMKQAADLHCNNLSQLIIDQYLRKYSLNDHLEKLKSAYGKKCRLMYDTAKALMPDGCDVNMPEGGMFLWVKLPEHIDTSILLDSALKENVIFVPGKYFFTNGKGQNTMRMNYTTCSEEEIITGVKTIASISAVVMSSHLSKPA